MSNPSLEWQSIGDKFYSKQGIYSMLWSSLDLAKYNIAAGSFGGPIATIMHFNKLISITTNSLQPILTIYTSSGRMINQINWDKGVVVKMGWTADERLCCILEQGNAYIYDLKGNSHVVSLGEDAQQFGVLDAAISRNNSIVILTGNYKFVVISDFMDARPKAMPGFGLNSIPDSWTILPGENSPTGNPEILVAFQNTIYQIDTIKAQDQRINKGRIQKMAISPNGQFLSLFGNDGHLFVVTIDFTKIIADFKTNAEQPPTILTWCGNDAVVMHWDDIILMVGPQGDYLKFPYDGVVHVVSDIDSCRIISSTKCEIIQKVSHAQENVFKLGSTASSAILFEAREFFDQKSHKADENIRSIKLFLRQAVDECIEAASFEYVPETQKRLMRASSFGKGFLENYPASKHVDMNRSLRILNSIRDPKVGIPLTYEQYLTLGPNLLLQILCNRGHFGLAKSICDYLRLPSEQVLISWACSQVQSTQDNEIISRAIFDKFSEKPGISYAQVANEAYKNGRTKLATLLLEYEPHPADQVPILLSMAQDELALVKSIEAKDAELVYLCIFHMKSKLTVPELFRIIHDKPLACNLLKLYAEKCDLQLLKDFYYQNDQSSEIAFLELLASFEREDSKENIDGLKSMRTKFESNVRSLIDLQISLIGHQFDLQNLQPDKYFRGLSALETMLECAIMGHQTKAKAISKSLNVSTKMADKIEFRAMVELQDWDGIERFVRSKPKFNHKFAIDLLFSKGNAMKAAEYVNFLEVGSPMRKEVKEYHERWLATMKGKSLQ